MTPRPNLAALKRTLFVPPLADCWWARLRLRVVGWLLPNGYHVTLWTWLRDEEEDNTRLARENRELRGKVAALASREGA